MLKQTALHAAHIAAGAKMGAFAGYDMPLYYDLGVKKEHLWVREKCGIFDVSHMGQVRISGDDVDAYLERLTPSSFGKLSIGRTKYSVLMNDNGGIIDDLMLTRFDEDEFHLVINAGCKDKDIAWMKAQLPENLSFKYLEDWALIAVQGPQAEAVVKDALGIDLSGLPYMALTEISETLLVSRLGYTGEDGFEIAVPNADAAALWDKLEAHEDVAPIGLAARDSLRLEMGYCLYGHDIDEETTPIEADLSWVIGKANTSFLGAEKVLAQKENGALKKRVGIEITGKGIAREGAEIRNADDQVIGTLTSGGFSPTLEKAIGQGYVPAAYAALGTDVFVNVRGRNIEAKVAALPFVKAQTKSAKAA